jgi:ABC-type uncharacterized transport system permease subunit
VLDVEVYVVPITTCKTFPVTAVLPDPPLAAGNVPVTLLAKFID